MEKTLFDDLKQSLKEVEVIKTGDVGVSRKFSVALNDFRATPAKTVLLQDELVLLSRSLPRPPPDFLGDDYD